MKVVRVLNNNVVLAVRPDDSPVVLTGLGVGFHARAGDEVDESKVSEVFVPENNRDSDNLGELVAAIPPSYLTLSAELLRQHLGALGLQTRSATVIALADHLAMAQRRLEVSGDTTNPLTGEAMHLYPREYAVARSIVADTNQRMGLQLPESEATAVTMHLVNAQFQSGDLTETYRMTGMFDQLFEVISTAFGIQVERHSVTAARFITHMRYFFVRAANGTQLQEGMTVLLDSLRESHPQAVNVAGKLGTILGLRLGISLTDDELAYLAMHVARLESEAGL